MNIFFDRAGASIRVMIPQIAILSPRIVELTAEQVRGLIPELARLADEATAHTISQKNATILRKRAAAAALAEEVERLERELEAGELSDVSHILAACFDETNRPVIVIGDDNSDREAAFMALLRRANDEVELSSVYYPTKRLAGAAFDLARAQGLTSPFLHFFSTHETCLHTRRSPRFSIMSDAGKHPADNKEGNLFDLIESRTKAWRDGKLVAFFDIADAHKAEAIRQYERARVFRLPIAKPGS